MVFLYKNLSDGSIVSELVEPERHCSLLYNPYTLSLLNKPIPTNLTCTLLFKLIPTHLTHSLSCKPIPTHLTHTLLCNHTKAFKGKVQGSTPFTPSPYCLSLSPRDVTVDG